MCVRKQGIGSKIADKESLNGTRKARHDWEIIYLFGWYVLVIFYTKGENFIYTLWHSFPVILLGIYSNRKSRGEAKRHSWTLTVWSPDTADVALRKGVEPVHITPKSLFRPHQRQYPLKPEAESKLLSKIYSKQEWLLIVQTASTISRMENGSRSTGSEQSCGSTGPYGPWPTHSA